MKRRLWILFLFVQPVLFVHPATAKEDESPSAFRFGKDPRVKIAIDKAEIFQGVRARGPDPRDVIPAIRDPKHVPAKEATWLGGKDRILGVVVNGEARAYPISVLEAHEMVNDVLGGRPIAPNY